MVFHVDLRYVVPPFVNAFLLLLQTNQDKPWNPIPIVVPVLDSPYLILKLTFLLFALFLLMSFFYVSCELPITFRPLELRTHGFSIALLLSLAASLLFPPPLFWFFFLCIIITYPWHIKLFYLFRSFLRWLAHTLRSNPIHFIIITRNQQNPNQDSMKLNAKPPKLRTGMPEAALLSTILGDRGLAGWQREREREKGGLVNNESFRGVGDDKPSVICPSPPRNDDRQASIDSPSPHRDGEGHI
ncbi:hypothetical protein QQP08_010283 [Theobroma cacao]|nr:hypothetical protein QQP08_010283 [Theobroma cacao]